MEHLGVDPRVNLKDGEIGGDDRLMTLRVAINLPLLVGGGFKYFLCSPLPGEMIQFDKHIFQRGWFNRQLDQSFFPNVAQHSTEFFYLRHSTGNSGVRCIAHNHRINETQSMDYSGSCTGC